MSSIVTYLLKIWWKSVNFSFLLAAGALSPVFSATNRERARSNGDFFLRISFQLNIVSAL